MNIFNEAIKPTTFFINCNPSKVTAQQKGAYVVPGGSGYRQKNHIRFFKKKRVSEAEKEWSFLFAPHAPKAPMLCPVSLNLFWVFPWRTNEKKSERVGVKPHDKRPDLDNLAKMVIDVMTKQGFWKDDGQICKLMLGKGWSHTPGLHVTVERVQR